MILRKFKYLFYTVIYLRPGQIFWRLYYKFYKSLLLSNSPLPISECCGGFIDVVTKKASLSYPFNLNIFCLSYDMSCSERWNDENVDKLILYNFHYFDCLCSSGLSNDFVLNNQLICKWISDNPRGTGNGWESYPLSLRIVNWTKWHLLKCSLSENALRSLAIQTRYLRKRLEVHLLGNHLLANAKALVFAGLFFQGAEAEEWYQKGLKIIERELHEQVLPDGGHFERSPMYHAIILEDLLDLINVLRSYRRPLPGSWLATAKKMLHWLTGMVHPDGEICFFNDSAMKIASEFSSLQHYAQKLEIVSETPPVPAGLTCFESSGYIHWSSFDADVFLDVAPVGPDYLPGHAHADTLSFELSLWKQRVFVNSGTSCYGVSAERLRQRSTSAHNTIEVDGENSSEVWGGFRVARRARPFNLSVQEQDNVTSVTCSHDGYRRLPGKVIHRRKWDFASRSLTIHDHLSGHCSSATSRLYLHPEVIAEMVGDNNVSIQLPEGERVCLEISGASSVCLEPSTWHPEFGMVLPNICLVAEIAEQELLTTIKW